MFLWGGVNILDGYDENSYVDLHNWTFTPKSFEILIYELNYLGYINFVVDTISKEPDSIEFFVILKRGKIQEINRPLMLDMMIQHKLESLECMREYLQNNLKLGERKFATSFYLDTGLGYSEAEKLKFLINQNSNNEFVIDVSLPKECKKIRWDLLEGQRVMLTNLEVKINDCIRKFSISNGESLRTRNAVIFDTLDPQLEYILPEEQEIFHVNIHGRLYSFY